MGISHSWNGTVLTITSDSGTSSADLKGDMGIRGPQGPAYTGGGDIDIDLTDYYTKEETAAIVSAEVESALTEAKESGAFKGDTGATGPTGPQGPAGPTGATGATGPAYTLTSADKTAIVNAVIAAIPVYDGEAVEA